MFQLLGKVASFPLGYLPTGYINHKENRLSAYRTAQVGAMYPTGGRMAGVLVQRSELAPRSLFSRWAEVLYLDHVIQELKLVRLSAMIDPRNPALNYISEVALTVLNRDCLKLPIVLLMTYKFHKKGKSDFQSNCDNYEKYRAYRAECGRRGAAMHPAVRENYNTSFYLKWWSYYSLKFTHFKFARDIHRISLKGHLLSTLANGIAHLTPQMFKTESVEGAARWTHRVWHSETLIHTVEFLYPFLLWTIVSYSLVAESFALIRNIRERFNAQSPRDTDDVMLIALLKRRNADKATLGKRVLNTAVAVSTCFTVFKYEPAAFLILNACHIGLVLYQNHYKFRMTSMRKEAADFWSKFMEGTENRFSLEEKRKLVEEITAGRVAFPSKKIGAEMEKHATRGRDQRILELIQQKALRQFIKNATADQVVQKVYEWICGHDSFEFFTTHFGFDAAWMDQVKEGIIPREQAVLFIQDLLHLE